MLRQIEKMSKRLALKTQKLGKIINVRTEGNNLKVLEAEAVLSKKGVHQVAIQNQIKSFVSSRPRSNSNFSGSAAGQTTRINMHPLSSVSTISRPSRNQKKAHSKHNLTLRGLKDSGENSDLTLGGSLNFTRTVDQSSPNRSQLNADLNAELLSMAVSNQVDQAQAHPEPSVAHPDPSVAPLNLEEEALHGVSVITSLDTSTSPPLMEQN